MPSQERPGAMIKQEVAPSKPKPGFSHKEKLAMEAGLSLFLAGMAHFADAGAHYLKHGDLDDYRFPEERLATWMYDFAQLNFGAETLELPGFVEASRTPEGIFLITGTPTATETATPEPSPTPPPTATREPTATPNPEPEILVTQDHQLWQEAEGVRQSLVEHEVKGVTVGVEGGLVVVRERETQNIVVHVDGWADKPDKWVVAETIEGTTQTPFIVDAEWAEIPSSLRLQPQEGTRWYVAYSDGSYFFAWRGQAEVVKSEWSMQGLYAGTRLKQQDRFEKLVWVEPPDVDTSDEAVDVWIDEMLREDIQPGSLVHFRVTGGYKLDVDYLRESLENVKTMLPEARAYMLAYTGVFSFDRDSGSLNSGSNIHLDRRYLDDGFGSRTREYLAAVILHEVFHTQQDKAGYLVACNHDEWNKEHGAYYLQYSWLVGRSIIEEHYQGLLENNSYETCSS